MPIENLDKMKVAELRAELTKLGMDTKGTKPVLLARLKEALANMPEEESTPEESPEPEVVEAAQVEPVEEEEEEDKDEAVAEVAEEVQEAADPIVEDATMEEEEQKPEDEKEEEHEEKEAEKAEEAKPGEDGDVEMAVKAEDKPAEETKKEGDKAADGAEKAGDKKQLRRGQKRKLDENEPFVVVEDEPEIDEGVVCLDWYNSDLFLKITKDNYMVAEPFFKEGWGYVWASSRATHGFSEGKVGFEVKLLEHLDAKLDGEKDARRLHEVRIGWTTDNASLLLGENKNSFCYSGSGKAGNDGSFMDYGASFVKDDVVAAFVDFTGDQVVFSFSKNGEDQETAYEIPKSDLMGKALFPTVNTKNVKIEVNFGKTVAGEEKEAWFALTEGYEFAASVENGRERGTARIAERGECEMIMMIGLPGSGKTTWVNDQVEKNPEKRYNVIGTSALIERMKVDGEPRKQHYEGKWDALIQKCTRCLQDWLRLASQRRRNYIIDQTNVYPNAQKRKVRPFEGMVRKAVVIVPSEEDYKARLEAQEKAESKDVPDNAVMEMKANFTLPAEGDESPFKEITFTELEREEAAKLVEKYNKDAKEKGFGKRQDQRNKKQRGMRGMNARGRMMRGRGFHPMMRGGMMRGGPPMRGMMRGGPPMRGMMRGGPPMRGGHPGMRGGPFGGPMGPMGMGGPMMGGPPMKGNMKQNKMGGKPQQNRNNQQGGNRGNRGGNRGSGGGMKNFNGRWSGGGGGGMMGNQNMNNPWGGNQWQQPQQQRPQQNFGPWGNGAQMGGGMGGGGQMMGQAVMGGGGMVMGGQNQMQRQQGGWGSGGAAAAGGQAFGGGGMNQMRQGNPWANQQQQQGGWGGNQMASGGNYNHGGGGYPGNQQWGGFHR